MSTTTSPVVIAGADAVAIVAKVLFGYTIIFANPDITLSAFTLLLTIIIFTIITIIIIMVFYGREKELELLGRLYKKLPGMIVITGRRRVGKTSLIKEFIKGKKSLYFFVDSNKSIEILLKDFNNQITETLSLPSYVKFENPEEFLDFLFTYQEDLVVVFDEFQRFYRLHPSFITQLQQKWDMRGESSHLYIILSGSSVGMMNKIFLDVGAPLFKRADNILTVKPFSPGEIWDVLDKMGISEKEQKLNLYLLFGGMIYYYRLFEKYGCTDLDSAFKNLLFDEFGPLRNEVRDVLVEEFGRLHPTYYEIISALARGKATQKEIADLTHIAPGSLPVYLNNLINLLGIVEYRIPATEDPVRSKKGRYFLKDNFFRFYAGFIYPNMSRFIAGNEGDHLRREVHKEWQSYSGLLFEDLVSTLLSNRLLGIYEKTGGWWNRRGDEIDFIAIGGDETPLAIEVKNREMSAKDALLILKKLSVKVKMIPDFYGDVKLGIVSKGITESDRFILKEDGYFVEDIFRLIERYG